MKEFAIWSTQYGKSVFKEYENNEEFKQYLDSDKAKTEAEKDSILNSLMEQVRKKHEESRLEYLQNNHYRVSTSYGISGGGYTYVVLTKHRDWKEQDRPFWIPIELAEQVVKELQAAIDFYKENK